MAQMPSVERHAGQHKAVHEFGTLPRPEISRQSIIFPVLGMTCAACQHHVEQALNESAGVLSARVDLMRHRAAVEFNPQITQPGALIGAIRDSGYDAVLPRGA